MKTRWYIFSLVGYLCLNYVSASPLEERESFRGRNFNSFLDIEQSLLIEKDRRKNDYENLKKAKAYIISGNVEMGEYLLKKIPYESKLVINKEHLLAWVAFLKNDFVRSYSILSERKFSSLKYYKNICFLKIANMMALNIDEGFNKELDNCSRASKTFISSANLWLGTIQSLMNFKKNLTPSDYSKKLKDNLEDTGFIKLWLKIALYLGKEDLIIKNIGFIPQSAYSIRSIRELLSLAYFRAGNLELAGSFSEGVETVNTENIKGNISLQSDQHQIAYGYFKLALEKKNNSKNALERIIPLSWLLSQWESGLTYLRSVVTKEEELKNTLALETAFKIRKGDHEEALRNVKYLEQIYKQNPPFEINLMKSFLSLKFNLLNELDESLRALCYKSDGLSCWTLMQKNIWPYLPEMIKRPDKVHPIEFDPNEYKRAKEVTPLVETVTIDQKDIEELDEADILSKIELPTD